MDEQINNFLTLLSGIVNNISESGTKEKVLENLINPVEWKDVFELAKSQNVYALIYEMATYVPDFVDSSYYQEGMIYSMKQIGKQIQRTDAFLKVYKCFRSEGVYPLVLKGIVCRELYGELSDHRPSGDEDIWVKKEDFFIIARILNANGFICENMDVSIEQLDELQEITFFNEESGLVVEVHINLMGMSDELRRKMNQCFEHAYDNSVEIVIDDVPIRTMKYTDHYLFLILHTLKHFTCGGIGIRQVLDFLLFGKKYYDQIDWRYIKRKLEKFDALTFTSDLVHIGNKYLGFDFETTQSAFCIEELLEDILGNGIFGNTTQSMRNAMQVTVAAVAGRGKSNGRIMTLIRIIFPGKERMIESNPVLNSKPWMLPFCWVKRWGRAAKKILKPRDFQMEETMKISYRRLRLLKKYKIM